jgi:adenosylmethionine-8-amino-7-oxononanoate aminotransferase
MELIEMAILTRKPKTASKASAKKPKAVTKPAAPKAQKAEPRKVQSKREIAKDSLQQMAKDHLWMHFTRQSVMETGNGVPIITKGDGHHIWDSAGNKYIDGLSGLFVVNAGHGRKRLAQAAAKQAEELSFFPLWSYAHPTAIVLADRLADYAPGDLNRVFFSTGGGEAVETAFKLAKHYWKLMGQPMKTKVISRNIAYHGTPQGALAITGLPGMKSMFEPLVPGTFHVPNTNIYRAEEQGYMGKVTEEAYGLWAANEIERMIQMEGPDTIAAVFLEPIQNAGGCFPPQAGYFKRVREICDQYDVLLVSDEVIAAFGRVGEMFACNAYGYVPDMITCAKAMTSGYSPIGATIISDRIYAPFKKGETYFPHGYTFGGHPVSAAVALENLDIFEEEDLNGNVRRNAPAFKRTLEKLKDIPIVGDVRGDGYFYGIELVKDQATKETFNEAEAERLLRGFLSKALYEAGLYCRADDRGDPVVQLAPPLTIGQPEFDEIEQIMRDVLTRATKLL